MRKYTYLGVVIFRHFVPDSAFGTHTMHVNRHGHFTLKQLRLSVLNEAHTNSYTGPSLYRLISFEVKPLFTNIPLTILTILHKIYNENKKNYLPHLRNAH